MKTMRTTEEWKKRRNFESILLGLIAGDRIKILNERRQRRSNKTKKESEICKVENGREREPKYFQSVLFLHSRNGRWAKIKFASLRLVELSLTLSLCDLCVCPTRNDNWELNEMPLLCVWRRVQCEWVSSSSSSFVDGDCWGVTNDGRMTMMIYTTHTRTRNAKLFLSPIPSRTNEQKKNAE